MIGLQISLVELETSSKGESSRDISRRARAHPYLFYLARYRNLSTFVKTFLVLILLSSLLGVGAGLAQELNATVLLNPWPPEGWSEGAEGAVHAVTADGELNTVFSFPIDETGQVTYVFPETLPRKARNWYQPIELATFIPCEGVTPIMSVSEASGVFIFLHVYADGEPWGVISASDLKGDVMNRESKWFWGMVYPQDPFTIKGAGQCRDGEMRGEVDLDVRAGPNVFIVETNNERTLIHTEDGFTMSQEVSQFDD